MWVVIPDGGRKRLYGYKGIQVYGDGVEKLLTIFIS
jgi:hypothetical protein